MRKQFNDESPRTGEFVGDLAYGRCNGVVPDKHGDYAGQHNMPIMPLILVRGRNPKYWSKDPGVKEAKTKTVNDQRIKNKVIESYFDNLSHMKANFHLTVGRQRL